MDSAAIALWGIVIGVSINLAVVVYGYGRLTSTVGSIKDDVKGIKEDVRDVNAKINGHIQWHAERP